MTDEGEIRRFDTPDAFRAWLSEHQDSATGVWLAIASAPGWCAVADSAGADADSEHGGSGVSLAALDLSAFGASAHDFDMAEAADPDGGTPLYLDVYFDERPAGAPWWAIAIPASAAVGMVAMVLTALVLVAARA